MARTSYIPWDVDDAYFVLDLLTRLEVFVIVLAHKNNSRLARDTLSWFLRPDKSKQMNCALMLCYILWSQESFQ